MRMIPLLVQSGGTPRKASAAIASCAMGHYRYRYYYTPYCLEYSFQLFEFIVFGNVVFVCCIWPGPSKVSQDAYTLMEESLSKPNLERLDRAARRLAPAADVVDRKNFCSIPEGYSIQEVRHYQ